MVSMARNGTAKTLTPTLAPDRYFDLEPRQQASALDLYGEIEHLPIVSPHGHVDPALFADPARTFGSPVELLVQPDHYILRMLYSQGTAYEQLLRRDDPHGVWQLFADNFYLLRATPSGLWFTHTLAALFDIHEPLDGASAQRIYTRIETLLAQPAFQPRGIRTPQHRGAGYDRRRHRHPCPPPGDPHLGLGGPHRAHLPA